MRWNIFVINIFILYSDLLNWISFKPCEQLITREDDEWKKKWLKPEMKNTISNNNSDEIDS